MLEFSFSDIVPYLVLAYAILGVFLIYRRKKVLSRNRHCWSVIAALSSIALISLAYLLFSGHVYYIYDPDGIFEITLTLSYTILLCHLNSGRFLDLKKSRFWALLTLIPVISALTTFSLFFFPSPKAPKSQEIENTQEPSEEVTKET